MKLHWRHWGSQDGKGSYLSPLEWGYFRYVFVCLLVYLDSKKPVNFRRETYHTGRYHIESNMERKIVEYGPTDYSHSDSDISLEQFIDHSRPGGSNYMFLRRGMETRKQHGMVQMYFQEQSGWYRSPSFSAGTKYRLTASCGSTGSSMGSPHSLRTRLLQNLFQHRFNRS